MTYTQILEQIADIKVTKSATSSRESAASFLKAAGIADTPKKPASPTPNPKR